MLVLEKNYKIYVNEVGFLASQILFWKMCAVTIKYN